MSPCAFFREALEAERWYQKLRRAMMPKVERRRAAIREIRAGFAAFGFDLSDFTDEEIECGVMDCARIMRECAIGPEDFARLGRAVAEFNTVTGIDPTRHLTAAQMRQVRADLDRHRNEY